MVETKELKTRQIRRKTKEAEKKKEATNKGKRERYRIIPIWVRLLIIAVLILLSTILGLMIGYGIIGNGDPADAIKTSTWMKIINLVQEGT